MLKYFNNTFLSLNPKKMKNIYFCPKGPAFSKFSQIEDFIFVDCECINISKSICLKNELQVKESDLFHCFGKKH